MSDARQGLARHRAPGWMPGARLLRPAGRPLVMGIVNLTPDSFYPASRHPSAGPAVDAAMAMVAAGADLLDLGAESSRPGAEPVGPDEELRRLLPVLRELRRAADIPVTVDTVRAATAAAALDEGADGINDISAGTADPDMLPLAAERGCGLVLMHMQGEPRTMQDRPAYDDVVTDVAAHLARRAAAAEAAGVAPDRIAVDPGIGFGKTLEHNLALMRNLPAVAGGRPLLLGASRKSWISHLTGADVDRRLGGSLAALAAALAGDATVVRVHDVAESIQFLDTLAAVAGAPHGSPGTGPGA